MGRGGSEKKGGCGSNGWQGRGEVIHSSDSITHRYGLGIYEFMNLPILFSFPLTFKFILQPVPHFIKELSINDPQRESW